MKMNDTFGSECLVPLAKVFGGFSRVDTRSEPFRNRPSTSERAWCAEEASKEIIKQVDALKLKRDLYDAAPPGE